MVKESEKTPLTPWICFISRLSMRYVGSEMNRMDFGPGQFFLLAELYAEEGLSQDELSRRVGVDKSNTSRALVKLEQYGLVKRKSDRQNHKVKKVFLNPKAHKIKRNFETIQEHWNDKLLKGFNEKEKVNLFSSLRRIAENAEAALDEPCTRVTKCMVA